MDMPTNCPVCWEVNELDQMILFGKELICEECYNAFQDYE